MTDGQVRFINYQVCFKKYLVNSFKKKPSAQNPYLYSYCYDKGVNRQPFGSFSGPQSFDPQNDDNNDNHIMRYVSTIKPINAL